jgi:MoaA/NifB/PqqE/SkfB family radical SAM enzyme
MTKNIKLESIEKLKNEKNPVIIFSVTEESEALKLSCEDNGIKVSAFCDNEIRKTKSSHCGLEVIYTPDLPKKYPNASFIIAHHTLDECAEQLIDLGYAEFFSPLQLFENFNVEKYDYKISKAYMKKKIENAIKINRLYFDNTKTYIRSLDIVITTKCSMNCESCANLMQYYTNAKNTDDKIVNAVNLISKNVDHISEFRIIGGEPLMNKNWAEITNKIIEQDISRSIYIYTNATICPRDDQLQSFKGKNVNFYITDYGNLSKNINSVIEILNKYNIPFHRRPAGNWVDCSQIKKHNRSPERLKQIFKECCAKTLYTLLNGKLYTCPFIANAGELRAIPENKADYVDLNLEPENLGEKIRKLVKKKTFFPACDFCDGRPHDPSKALEYAGKGLIKAGIQLNRSQKIPFNKF